MKFPLHCKLMGKGTKVRVLEMWQQFRADGSLDGICILDTAHGEDFKMYTYDRIDFKWFHN